MQTYPDGKIYKGNYDKDIFNGNGKLIYVDGKFQEGEFKNGKIYKDTSGREV